MAKKKSLFKEAQAIRKQHPNMDWQVAIKKASKQRKNVGAYKVIEKGEKRSAPARKVVQVQRSKKGRYQGTKTVGKVVGAVSAKTKKQNQLKNALWDYEKATTISATKEARKRIIKYRKELKSL